MTQITAAAKTAIVAKTNEGGAAGMSKVLETITNLKKMSVVGLVDFAQKNFQVDLKGENGKTWLIKKIGYMVQEKVQGSLPEKVTERAKLLDDPKVIAEMKLAEEKTSPTTSIKQKKNGVGVDEDGFKIDSKGSRMFALLKKGCTIEKLAEVGGNAVKGFTSGIKCQVGLWPAARAAKIENDGKRIWLREYTTKDGKKVKLTDAVTPLPKKTEPKKTEPKKTEPKKTEPKKTEPKKTEPKKVTPKTVKK